MMYNDVEQGNHLGNISGVFFLKIHLISEVVACGGQLLSTSKGKVVNQLLLNILLFCSFHLLCHVWCQT